MTQCSVQTPRGLQCRNSANWVVSGKPICKKHADMIRAGRAVIIESQYVNGITGPCVKVEQVPAGSLKIGEQYV